MEDIILLLPDSIANQIAAGEVVQRPASVVKELMENSVDASSSHIIVQIKDAGKSVIQIIDELEQSDRLHVARLRKSANLRDYLHCRNHIHFQLHDSVDERPIHHG